MSEVIATENMNNSANNSEMVFDTLYVYAEQKPWNVVNERRFTDTEINAIRSNVVVDSQYGKSVCFFLKKGGQTYIPISNRSKEISVGSSINMQDARLLTLHREGNGNILRVEF